MKRTIFRLLFLFEMISTMFCVTACGKSGEETAGKADNNLIGQTSAGTDSSDTEDKGPFFLIAQNVIPEMSSDMIPDDWSYAEGGIYLQPGSAFDLGDFKCSLHDRKVYGDTLCEMVRILGEKYQEANQYLDVGTIFRIYSQKDGLRVISVSGEDLLKLGNSEGYWCVLQSLVGYDNGKLYTITEKCSTDPENEEALRIEKYLGSIDASGNLELIAEIPEKYEDWEFFMDRGILCALTYDGYRVCSFDDKYSNPVEMMLPMRAQGYFSSQDGNAYLYGVWNKQFWIRDEADKDAVYQFGEPYSFTEYMDYSVAVNENGVVIAADSNGAYRYESGELTYCSFNEQDITLDYYNGAYITDDGGFAVFASLDGNYSVFNADPCESNPKYLKTNIVMLAGFNDAIKYAAARYNRSNPDYRISFYKIDESEDFETWSGRVSIEMASGKGPDIIASAYIDYNTLAANGGIVSLDDVVGTDDDGYIPAAFENGRIKGTQFSIPYIFYLKTFATSESISGGRNTWTLSEFMSAIENSGVEKAINMSPAEIVLYFGLWEMDNKSIIDWENRKSNLEDSEFINLLEFAKEYGIDEKKVYDNSTKQDIYDGKIACRYNTQLELEEIAWNYAYYKKDPVYIGFPSESKGGGAYAFPGMGLCINSDSKNIDAAKDFLRWLISYEGQKALYDYQYSQFHGRYCNFSIRWDIIDKQIEDYNVYNRPGGHMQVGEDGKAFLTEPGPSFDGVLTVKSRQLSDDEILQFMEMIRNARPISSELDDLRPIVDEELGAFLAGQKTAEETAKIIDSRVQLYLDENR